MKELTTEEKEKALNGKRYSIVNGTIAKAKENGKEMNHDLQIHLHYSWMKTIAAIKEGFNSSMDKHNI